MIKNFKRPVYSFRFVMCWPIGSLVDLGYPRTFFGNSRGGIIGPQLEKICLRGLGNNKGADQPAHSRSLISSFVIH